MSGFYSLPVSDITKETPNSVSITFTIPNELKDTFSFKAGQYITIKHKFKDTEIRRAYSICCSPDDDKIKVGVKQVDGGVFSVFANSKLKVGDTLEVLPPEGKFVFDPTNEENGTISNNYAAFVAGSGITPVLSIVKTVLKEVPDSTFLLVYGNKSLSETMFHSEILALQKQYKDRLFVEFVYSRKLENDALFGRIERSTVNLLLKNKFKDTRFNSFYLCGPEPMIDAVSSTLKENGINEKQILFELFSTSEKGLLTQSHDGNTAITITLDDEVETFSMSQKKSILDAALDHDMDPPYSCQGGICSTCIARITEGKAEMRKNQILTDDEIADGLILTCQAHPTTATIAVNYDDV